MLVTFSMLLLIFPDTGYTDPQHWFTDRLYICQPGQTVRLLLTFTIGSIFSNSSAFQKSKLNYYWFSWTEYKVPLGCMQGFDNTGFHPRFVLWVQFTRISFSIPGDRFPGTVPRLVPRFDSRMQLLGPLLSLATRSSYLIRS